MDSRIVEYSASRIFSRTGSWTSSRTYVANLKASSLSRVRPSERAIFCGDADARRHSGIRAASALRLYLSVAWSLKALLTPWMNWMLVLGSPRSRASLRRRFERRLVRIVTSLSMYWVMMRSSDISFLSGSSLILCTSPKKLCNQ